MMESEVMGNYHASFGERDGETRTMRIVKVRAVPTPPSPVLMNLTLNGLERSIRGAFPRFQGSQRTKVHVIRFADDFIITGRTRAFLEQEVYPLVEQCLAARGLELAHAKTRSTHSEDGFDCLGTHLRK